jgi:plasmid stabilization system protein ParE
VKQVRISSSAEADLLNGFVFYERQQTGIGSYFLDSLFADIDSLALFAGLHPRHSTRLHRTRSKRFPFAIYYELVGDAVTVIAILDYRQDPGAIHSTLESR